MLVDVLPEGRYRYRLIGTANVQAQGIHATGCYLDEVLPGPEYKEHVIALYDECVGSRLALYSECLFMSTHRRRRFFLKNLGCGLMWVGSAKDMRRIKQWRG